MRVAVASAPPFSSILPTGIEQPLLLLCPIPHFRPWPRPPLHNLNLLQIVNKRAYVVGEAPSYESRLLGIKRQLLPLWMHGQLPEGLDVRT